MPSTPDANAPTASDRDDARSLPAVDGILGGAGAYLLGFLLTYLWKAGEYRDALARIGPLVELFGGETPAAWKLIGWLYYSAHFVDTRVDAGPVTTYVDLVGEGAGALELLYLLPPLFLLAAGFLVARRTAADTIVAGARAGATVTIGYLALVLVGVLAIQVGGSGPELVPALVVAGIVYPLVFGTIGGSVWAGAPRR